MRTAERNAVSVTGGSRRPALILQCADDISAPAETIAAIKAFL